MKCPNCNETLLMTERHRVEIDYCPSCRGVWLDKGELDKLMDYATSQAQPPRTSDYNAPAANRNYPTQGHQGYEDRDRDYRDNKDYNQRYPKKKKSFLSDFFDFD